MERTNSTRENVTVIAKAPFPKLLVSPFKNKMPELIQAQNFENDVLIIYKLRFFFLYICHFIDFIICGKAELN